MKSLPRTRGRLFTFIFKVLIIFYRLPCPTPLEPTTGEQFPHEVAPFYLIRKRATTVGILGRHGRLHRQLARPRSPNAWVVERVDVNGHAPGVGRQLLAATHHTITKTARIVGAHRRLVAGAEIVDKANAGYGIAMLVELLENLQHVVGYSLVANHLAMTYMALQVDMQQLQMAQVLPAHGASRGIALALHPGKDRVGYHGNGKAREPLLRERQ